MANDQQQPHNLDGLEQSHQVVVVMVPLPAQGHLNQLLHLSKLILSYNIPVHFVGTATHNRQANLRFHGWDAQATSNIHFHDFEVPSFSCPPPNPNAKIKFPSHLLPAFHAGSHLQEPVSVLLRSLSTKVKKIIVIHDSLMASVIQEVPLLPNAEAYTFHSVSAFTMCLFYWEKIGKPIDPNGQFPKQLPSLDGSFTHEFLNFIASQYKFHYFNSGYIYNTSRLIEGTYLDLIKKQHMAKKESNKHFALGPFCPVSTQRTGKYYCLEWLDKQETNSVIYVSFGTTTAMGDEQIKQLANGLKQSNQKFIWVLREADKGDIFNQKNERRVELPNGYEKSISGMGLIARDWVPQLEILGHRATGGFMSHCGWNSCMESISMGTPIAAWPMHSDQPRNTVLITEYLEIGIVVREWERRDEIVTSKMIETCVKRLMASDEGDELRKRAAELGESVRRSMGEGGLTRMEMDSFIAHISS